MWMGYVAYTVGNEKWFWFRNSGGDVKILEKKKNVLA
jgi:hypothetical protein